ncbi:hypothetical protein H2O64_15155 [Kordia sp. YSTF-M3]|uniref:FtsX-like permease family protein n=1 Tax=Kordia aestuariivivens TaxID=2759037 RepID=A0ABR7QBR1_9FLAO|nr:hypothetical protein [Kordia aestuariivivens]MBC8756014.1 hypothetical protein [Kordia aestuariivivens]
MIRTLLNKQIHFSQLLFFALTSSLGLGILLVAFQLFIDTQSLFSTSNDLLGNQNLIIYKDLGRNNAFTPEEISTITQQDFVKKVGGFTHGTYRVVASVSIANYSGISTEMFLEAIPDNFIDIESPEWKWKPGAKEVPIIIPKNYINLYNFGYAASTGMKQIDENLIREIPIELTLIGSSKREEYNAYILAASEKINSILVPESFLKYTNQTLSPEKVNKVSRIILDVTNPSDPNVLDFLNSNNYKYLKNDVQTSRISYFLQLILMIVLGIGILITVLSITLVITNINLLILKNKQTICQLHFLGFSRAQIAKVYHQISYKILGISILIAFLLAVVCKFTFAPYLAILQSESSSFSLVYVFAFAIILFVVLAIYYTKHTNRKIQQMTAINTSLLTSEI